MLGVLIIYLVMNFSSLMKTEGRCCAFIVTFFIYSEEINLSKRSKKANIFTTATTEDGTVIKHKTLVGQVKQAGTLKLRAHYTYFDYFILCLHTQVFPIPNKKSHKPFPSGIQQYLKSQVLHLPVPSQSVLGPLQLQDHARVSSLRQQPMHWSGSTCPLRTEHYLWSLKHTATQQTTLIQTPKTKQGKEWF